MDKLLKQIGSQLQKELINKLLTASQDDNFDKESFFTEDNLKAIFSDASADINASTKKTRKKKEPRTGPARTNTWMVYMAEQRPVVKEENPSAKFQDIAKIISVTWKKLTDNDKLVYKAKADEINKNNGISPPTTPKKTPVKKKAPNAPKKKTKARSKSPVKLTVKEEKEAKKKKKEEEKEAKKKKKEEEKEAKKKKEEEEEEDIVGELDNLIDEDYEEEEEEW